jgi:hypothetical protein
MLEAKKLLSYGKSALIELLSLGNMALIIMKDSKLVQALSRLQMLHSTTLFTEGERALIERLGLRVHPLLLVQFC